MTSSMRIVDLTHPFDESTVHWPGDQAFSLRNDFDGLIGPDRYYYANTLTLSEHVGTHIDAPRHMNRDGLTVDQIPLERLIGPGVVIDAMRECKKNRDCLLRPAVLTQWESRNGPIPSEAIVLFRTGHSRLLPNSARYLGTSGSNANAQSHLRFPGLHPETARWLVDNRRVRAVGIDCPGIDPGNSTTFETHRILFAHNVPALENLANLDQLPPTGFTVFALPLKIKGGSGAPLRVIAVLDADAEPESEEQND